MSSSRGPYQSRLFSNLNRQSQRLRDRLGETVRQIKVAAEWGVQALIYPLYWLLHPQKWLGPILGAGGSGPKPVLPSGVESATSESEFSIINVDNPIKNVLTFLRDYFDQGAVDESQALVLSQNLPLAINLQVFPSPVENNLALTGQGDRQALTPAPSPSLLAKLGDQVKSIFQSSPDEIVIQGLASRCDDHCLVLTTKENLTLDVFSPEQQSQLQQQIRQELAKWHYQRRQQWALTQKQWRGIPLISNVVSNGEIQKVIAPLDWIWQGIYRWQTRPALVPLKQSTKAMVPVVLPPADLSGLKHWLEQTATSLAQQPIIEATVVRSQQLSQQIVEVMPPTVQHLGQDLQQKFNQLFSSENHPQQTPDPFELKVILQAAIAYFFGGRTGNLSLKNGHNPALPGENQSQWLAWEDLFAGLPTPPLVTPLLANVSYEKLSQANDSEPWTEENLVNLNSSSNFALTHSPRNVTMAISVGGNPGLINSPHNPWQSGVLDDPWQEKSLHSPKTSQPRKKRPRQLNSTGQIIRNPRQEQELETAFDWIEAQAKSLGYDKHILVWCLEWLDRLVYWLEQGLENIWHWLRQIFTQAESTD